MKKIFTDSECPQIVTLLNWWHAQSPQRAKVVKTNIRRKTKTAPTKR